MAGRTTGPYRQYRRRTSSWPKRVSQDVKTYPGILSGVPVLAIHEPDFLRIAFKLHSFSRSRGLPSRIFASSFASQCATPSSE